MVHTVPTILIGYLILYNKIPRWFSYTFFLPLSFYGKHTTKKKNSKREKKMFGFDRISHSSANKADEIDLESGETLYPGLSYGENQLRWGFIRKVYGILAAQLVLTTVVSAFVVLSAPVNELLRGNSGLLLFLCLIPFVCKVLTLFFFF